LPFARRRVCSEYYSLQCGLASGATYSSALSVAMASVIIAAMTRSARATVLAALAILAIVAAETGVLVGLLGWRLGIIEVPSDGVSHKARCLNHSKVTAIGGIVEVRRGDESRARALPLSSRGVGVGSRSV